VVVLADGRFPGAPHCLEVLDGAGMVICCDGAAGRLLEYGRTPDVIIGDMDSLSEELKERFASIIVEIEDQESNDLTKAMRYCREQAYKKATILGATGHREDHSLGNISLLLEYNRFMEVDMISDHGIFFPARDREKIPSYPGERFSIFSLDNRVRVTSNGLLYPLAGLRLTHWYTASLNEATGHEFILEYHSAYPLIVFRVI